MIIKNEFTVSVPVDKAWEVLTDLEQVVPLMPGATLVGVEGDDFLGKVKVKIGPVTSEFNGKARFTELDATSHRALIDASGKESRGSGNAAATVTLQLHEAGDRTRVTVDSDVKIVGKLAQFGSGMIQQVSEKLLGQFVEQLENRLVGGAATAAAAPRVAPAPEPEAIDLLELAGGTSITKYAGAGAAGLVLLILAWLVLRRRHRG